MQGIIFVVDAAAIAEDTEALRETATYLHDVLLQLQNSNLKSSKRVGGWRVLVAANKNDLFTALPARLVERALEGEIERVRESRRRGLVGQGEDGGVGRGGEEEEEGRGWLGELHAAGGEGGKGRGFRFKELGGEEGGGLEVEVVGGNVVGGDVGGWWSRVGGCL